MLACALNVRPRLTSNQNLRRLFPTVVHGFCWSDKLWEVCAKKMHRRFSWATKRLTIQNIVTMQLLIRVVFNVFWDQLLCQETESPQSLPGAQETEMAC